MEGIYSVLYRDCGRRAASGELANVASYADINGVFGEDLRVREFSDSRTSSSTAVLGGALSINLVRPWGQNPHFPRACL